MSVHISDGSNIVIGWRPGVWLTQGAGGAIDYTNDSPAAIAPTLGAELLANADLSTWSGDNPTGWFVVSESGSDPEVTERDSGQLHADTKTVGGAANFYASTNANNLRIQQNVMTAHGWYQWSVTLSARATNALRLQDDSGTFFRDTNALGTLTVRGRSPQTFLQIKPAHFNSAVDLTVDGASCKPLSNYMVAERANVPIGAWGYNHWHVVADRQGGGYLKYDDDDYIYWYVDRVMNRVYLVKVVANTGSQVGFANITYSDTKAVWFRHAAENTWQIGYDTPANIEAYGDADWAANALISASTVTNRNLNLTGNRYEFGALSSDEANTPQVHRYISIAGVAGQQNAVPDPNDFTASNAADHLDIPTSDGSGQAVHPSVVKFDTAWNGYTYWMAMTPFPYSNDDYENPEILASNDGDTWVVPEGLTNPIAPSPGGTKWNADTELVYDPSNDKLYCFYEETDGATYVTIKVRSSSDGVNWSAATDVVTGNQGNNLSPTVIHDGTQWVMYTIGGQMRRYTASQLDGTWTQTTNWQLLHVPAALASWHIHVHLHDGIYYMLVAEANDDIYLAIGEDGVSFKCGQLPLLQNGTGNWDTLALYRGCSLKMANGLDIWYSGRSAGDAWHIGRTQATLA